MNEQDNANASSSTAVTSATAAAVATATSTTTTTTTTTTTKISLTDKFDLDRSHQLLTGSQAVVRMMLMQSARDKAAGLNTAGYVTGYRGSPIAALEGTFQRFQNLIDDANILFHSGLNEDLAATALWGAQQAELRGEGKYDGVFGLWYGKGPGVDRSGDAFRHANHAGTSKHGGVLALMGDDHTCESSTSAHQSEFAFVDAMMPVLNPAGVQEILDFGLIGYGLSRYAGVWVGMKCVKDNIESTATVDGSIDRVEIKTPDDFTMPEGGLNIRLVDAALAKEARLHDYKRDAILAFGRANNLDQIIFHGGTAPKIGIMSAGKSYLDTRQALDELGIDEVSAAKMGLRLYKVGMTYPMEPQGFHDFARGLDLVIVIEEKRALLEVQALEQLYGTQDMPVLVGKKDENGGWLFPAKGALDPVDIAISIGERLVKFGTDATGTDAQSIDGVKSSLSNLKQLKGNRIVADEIATRIPYFCAGCPHNSSTIIPDGARAYAGIGCHYMVQWMDRNTDGFTQMGAEGVNWIGEAPFSTRRHVFQNLGDGTYIHSGSLAIRAAVAARTNITFKILYNDAVAMTGGQSLDGGISVGQMAAQVLAEGVKDVAIVTDEPAKYDADAGIPPAAKIHHRDDLQLVQIRLAEQDGVTVLIYDQTCAAEKRRRRKRGTYPDPAKRIFINAAVCEGCGDCGVQSNCVAITPLETELGRKREIDQSACNKDFSCVNGFCPSFVTVNGASVRKGKTSGAVAEQTQSNSSGDSNANKNSKDTSSNSAAEIFPHSAIAKLPEPTLPDLTRPYTMLVTGVGGTGVVTISAVLGQAAYLDGKGFGAIDMTGLAQKGGAVACHMRLANDPQDIHAIRAGVASADLILGCDLMVTAANKVLETVKPDHTAILYNSYEMTTGAFALDPTLTVPGADLQRAIKERAGTGLAEGIDAHDIALRLFGDSIMSNMFMLGFAYQKSLVPINAGAIAQAIALNGVAVALNQQAFEAGRLAAHDLDALHRLIAPQDERQNEPPHQAEPNSLTARLAYRAAYLTDYQDDALVQRYQHKVKQMAELEQRITPHSTALHEAVALSYFKLLAYKDEYEVARLFSDGTFEAQVRKAFNGDLKLEFHLAPPLFARRDKLTGLPRKMKFGAWVMPVFRLLAKGKSLRGGRWDLFGYTAERKLERQMIADYERLLDDISTQLTPQNHHIALELAQLAQMIKGFGHIKLANYKKAEARKTELLQDLHAAHTTPAREAAE